MKARRETLRRRLTREALMLLLLFQCVAFAAGAVLVVRPLLLTATSDLAVVMRLAATRWVDTHPPGESAVTPYLDERYALWLQSKPPPDLRDSYFPFAYVLGHALAAKAGREDSVPVRVDAQHRYWAPVEVPGRTVWVGFAAERVGTRPPLLLALLALALLGLAIGFSVLVAARMTRPLNRLVAASERLGQGDTEVRVPETGPHEVAALSRAFNGLAARLRELLDNRATLLVGLSHDLRTPLARLRLSLEMVEDARNAELVAGMTRDLDALKALLDDVLMLERGLHLERGQQAPIGVVVQDVVEAAQRAGQPLEWTAVSCARQVSELALRRVLENLLDNARRYAGHTRVTVALECSADMARVMIRDRGPGIPVDQREAVLRPFYRLEASRSSDTGGSGLGLAIVQQICRAQGWRLALSEPAGGGLEVTLTMAAWSPS